ncbi:MAG: hypothetical protein IJ039_05180 [Clostridia bacterium]|nr:hypothetical protein [Clostridia bacterium]
MARKQKKMNSLVATVLFVLSLPFVLIGLVLFGLMYVITTILPAPVEIIVYKSSQFYKDLKRKYTLGITSNFGYKSYKYVKQNPELEFVCQEEGYYYYRSRDSIFVLPYYAGYYKKGNDWMMTMNKDGDEASIDAVRDTFAMLIKEDISEYDVKLLVKEKHFKKSELNEAKSHPVFVFYKNHKSLKQVN